MHKSICVFKREFQIWGYACNHGHLLLRSKKSKVSPTRVDILFADVRSIELRSFINSLEIVQVDLSQIKNRSLDTTNVIESGHKIYLVQSWNWTGCIIAGSCQWHEDNLEYGHPSALTNAFK